MDLARVVEPDTRLRADSHSDNEQAGRRIPVRASVGKLGQNSDLRVRHGSCFRPSPASRRGCRPIGSPPIFPAERVYHCAVPPAKESRRYSRRPSARSRRPTSYGFGRTCLSRRRDARCFQARHPAGVRVVDCPLRRANAVWQTSSRVDPSVCVDARARRCMPALRRWSRPLRPSRERRPIARTRALPSDAGDDAYARTRRRGAHPRAAEACTEHRPRRQARRNACADDGHAGRHDDRAVDVRHRHSAARAWHRRERLVFPRPRRSVVLAPVQPSGAWRETLGRGEAARSVVHVRQALLVVQHVRVGRLFGHAASDVSGRRAQAARCLHPPGRASRRIAARARTVPAVPLLGSGGRHREHALDRPLRDARLRAATPHADARLPAAPRLQPAALRPRPSGDRARSSGRRRRLRRTDRGGRARRRAGRRAVRIRRHRRLESDPRQPGAARGRLAARARRARSRAARRRRVGCVRRGRPPDCARLRRAARARARREGAAAQPAGRRARARRSRQALARPRPSALGRARRDLGCEELVHVLPLPRRRARARLRAHRRHPSQARLRPGRAVRRSEAADAEAAHRDASRAEGDRHAIPDGRHLARRDARARLSRPPDRPARRRAAVHHVDARAAARRDRSRRPT